MQKVAVVGVKSDLGREFLNLLSENEYNYKNITALESKSVLGSIVSYGQDDELDVLSIENYDFEDVDIAVFACSKEIGKRYIKNAVKSGCKVIDLCGANFTNAEVPLVIPSINGENVKAKSSNIISVPSATVYQVLLPLSKIIQENKLKRLVINTYNSTSYMGREAMDELFAQSRKIFMNQTLADDKKVFQKQIAFNVLPQVGEFIGDETNLEWAINAEIKKIMPYDIKVHANCAFVPTFIGDGVFVNAEFYDDVDADEVKNKIKEQKNVIVFDNNVDGGYVSVEDVQGEDNIYISRIRQDVSVENGISYWSVADNIRAGGAKLGFEIMTEYFIEQ